MPAKRALRSYYFCNHVVKPGRPDCTNRARFRVAEVDPVIWQVLTEGLIDPQRVQDLLRPYLEAMAEEGEAAVRLRTLQERLATLEKKASEILLLDTSTALAREHVAKLLAQLDQERASLQQEGAVLQATGKEGGQLPTSGTEFFQHVRQWLLGTTLAEAVDEGNNDRLKTAGGSEGALTAPVPAELHALLMQIRRHIVRELISAVFIGPDGTGVIVLRDNNHRLLVQVQARPPKRTVWALQRKAKSV